MSPYIRQLESDFARCRIEHPDWISVISEGDSWFSYPFERNLLDWLDDPKDTSDSNKQTQWALLRLEGSGDEILSIMSGGQRARLRQYLSVYKPHALLFSGGGNDIVGPDVLALLLDYKPGFSATQCLRLDRLERRLRQIRDSYLELQDLVTDNSPETVIFTHGYDHPVPSSKGVKLIGIKLSGPWLKPYFENRGIPEVLQREIAKLLMDRFNDEILAPISGLNFIPVNFRGTVVNDWCNEIHPNRKGSKRLASLFKSPIVTRFPQLHFPGL